ncbi:MAG: hypothetical protein M1297_00625 [Nitrospirae bacterium]|nr:hypothetical protein [Nitrospirota bacterium]
MNEQKTQHSIGICNACGESDVDLYKISLGKDFFDRPYDRLSAAEDTKPQWYCGDCSREKDFQRDIRSIRTEFERLREGRPSLLSRAETARKAVERVALIEQYVKRGRKVHTLLPPREVGTLLVDLTRYFLQDTTDPDDI